MPGPFTKDLPDGSVTIDGGGHVDVWTSEPDEHGRRSLHLSVWSTDHDDVEARDYDPYVTVNGENRPTR